MALKVDEVARLVAIAGMEEVVETNLQQGRQRRVGRDVAADAGIFLVLPMHHGHGVPADQAFDAPFQIGIAGIGHFLVLRNGIQVWRDQLARRVDAGLARAAAQCRHQFGAMLGPLRDHDLVKGLDPLGHLFGKACLGWHCLFCAHRSDPLAYEIGLAVGCAERHGPLPSIASVDTLIMRVGTARWLDALQAAHYSRL